MTAHRAPPLSEDDLTDVGYYVVLLVGSRTWQSNIAGCSTPVNLMREEFASPSFMQSPGSGAYTVIQPESTAAPGGSVRLLK